MTAPLVVIAKVTKEEFRTRDLSSYTFEVIGGVHRYLALLKISKKMHLLENVPYMEQKCNSSPRKPAK